MARLRSLLRSLRIWSVVVVLLIRLWWDGRQWTYLSGASETAVERRQHRLASWLLRALAMRDKYPHFVVRPASALIGLIGLYWGWERLLGVG